MELRDITKSFKIVAVALVVSAGLNFAMAWTGPATSPPGGNILPPINASAVSQYKAGALGIGGLLVAYSNVQLSNTVTSWATCASNGLLGLDTSGDVNLCKAGVWTPLQTSTAGGSSPLYVDDVFSTYLYTGNGTSQTINNGIDLAGQGGMVWMKDRASNDHQIYDTVRGVHKRLAPNDVAAEGNTSPDGISVFNSNGWTMGQYLYSNGNNHNFVSWTFREAPKFFDVVTWTGNGTTQTINHNLGVAPGMVVIKRTSGAEDWNVWHRGVTFGKFLQLNTIAAEINSSINRFGNNSVSVDPMSTQFTVGSDAGVNASGNTYVAYLFAHDPDTTNGIIQGGSFTTDGSGNATVNLGWEPQYVLMKRTDVGQNWFQLDTMRGWVATANASKVLIPNASSAESTVGSSPTATGFTTDANLTNASATYIYLAIRRPPTAVNGACGSANGVAVSSAPSTNLCSAGTASSVSGTGPWNWTCNGSGGGTNASCSAPVQSAVNCVGSWGSCSASCDGGTQTYTVTTPASGGGTSCPYTNGATQSCNTQSCPEVCNGSWSSCSASCGGGTQTYTASGSDSNCPYNTGSTQSCNTQSCPHTWQVGPAGSYSYCTVGPNSGGPSIGSTCSPVGAIDSLYTSSSGSSCGSPYTYTTTQWYLRCE